MGKKRRTQQKDIEDGLEAAIQVAITRLKRKEKEKPF